MINVEQLRDYIITPTLNDMNLFSNDAVELLLFTAATESKGGTYLHQIKGSAIGIYQMEPATHDDLWQFYVMKNHRLMNTFATKFNVSQRPKSDRMLYDLRYATAMARVFYLKIPDALPNSADVNALFDYYKRFWNTSLGKATAQKSIKAYQDYVGAAP